MKRHRLQIPALATLLRPLSLGWGVLALLFCTATVRLHAQTETFATGSYIINMGITPQTVNNGLKPYGMVYDLVKNFKVPVRWAITPGKAKDAIDFSHNSIAYRGGAFIIPAEYRSAAVNARITFWTSAPQNVVGATTVSPLTVNVVTTLIAMPEWSLDKQSGSIATGYFVNAGIPATAHGGANSNLWPTPATLDCCDDLFVMPHADPVWGTHQNLFFWNDSCNGSIWLACHAGSALEDMFNTAIPAQQTNFLSNKTGVATGGGPWASNALILWGSHGAGTLPYSYDLHDDPIMQFMGILDGATTNGSEQIYVPYLPGWRATTKIGVWDPDHPDRVSNNAINRAAVLAYGRAFGDNNRGFVMLEAAHSHNKATAPANVAAQRAFFNFSFYTSNVKALEVAPTAITAMPNTFNAGTPVALSYIFPMGVNPADYTPVWTSSCGGTFSPNAMTPNVSFTPPAVGSPTPCIINVSISNACAKTFVLNQVITVNPCLLTFNNTITNVTCNGLSTGSISMGITGGTAPYNYNWSRVSPAGTGMGVGTTISGLSAGTYNVTVTATGGCTGTFTALVSQPTVLTATRTFTNYLCFGQTGSINLTAAGGTPGYTYDWTDLAGPSNSEDRSGLTAGTYTVSVTDANGCIASTSATITGPATAITPSATMVNVSCFGGTNGSVDLSVTGGTPGYTYLWSTSATSQDISGLAAGTYIVTVTDLNGCTATLSKTITQPTAPIAVVVAKMDPTCPPGGTPPLNANGTIDLTVSGGTGPYTYDWADVAGPSNSEDRTGLAAGTYMVTVTDANGCTAMVSVTLVNLNSLPNAPTIINN